MDGTKVDVVVDARGLACPMPIVKAKKMIDTLQPGQVMEVWATDKGSLNDFTSWVSKTNNELIDQKEEEGVFKFFVRKKG